MRKMIRRRTISVNVILEDGVIRTLDQSLPTVRSLAVAGDRVAGGVGTHETALPGAERVDLGGRCVVPGFTDSHVHFPTWAIAQDEVRLEDTRSLDEALARVRDAVARAPEDRWLRGRGWRSGDWLPAVEPTKEALDEVVSDRPVALMARDSHSVWLNSAALARANGDLQVPGGVVELDERGEPTGVLREESCWHFRDAYIETTDDEYVEAMRFGLRLAASRGVTTVHDKDGWLGALRFWQRLEAEGALTLRVWQSVPGGFRGRAGDGRHPQRSSAAHFCGSATSRPSWTARSGRETARMLDGSGVEITSREQLVELIRAGAARRVPARRARDRRPREPRGARCLRGDARRLDPLGLRPRIEHAQLLAPEDIARFAELGVAASVQFSHATSDRDLADRFWGGLDSEPYAFRSLLDSGAVVANGSDAPIEELDPLAGICAGVLRTIDERPAWRPEQALTAEQALVATCLTPAWLSGDEHRRGKLLPGFYADLVVLDRDPLDCQPEELPEVRVVATMLGGSWTHNPPPW